MPSKNQPCPCGSGLAYKYCHIGSELRERTIQISLDRGKKVWALVNLKNDILNIASSGELPLKYFCKDNGIYFFSMAITIGEADRLDKMLKAGTLTKLEVLETFKRNSEKETLTGFLDLACQESELYQRRKHLISEGINLHFERRYAAAIALLFPQLEGILRQYGNIADRDGVRPVIPRGIWEENSLYSVEDDAENFNRFIHGLFEGGKDKETFNRNPILHGFNINFESEEHSLLLILAILEIRLFMIWSKQTAFSEDLKHYLMKQTGGQPSDYIGAHFEKLGAEIDIFQFPG